MNYVDGTDAAAKMVRNMDERDDQANGVEYSDNRAKVAVVGIREELAAIGASHVYIYRALRAIQILLIVVVVELAIIAVN